MQGAAVVEGDIAGTVFDRHGLALVYLHFQGPAYGIAMGGVDMLDNAPNLGQFPSSA